jgi:hypothetical protein
LQEKIIGRGLIRYADSAELAGLDGNLYHEMSSQRAARHHLCNRRARTSSLQLNSMKIPRCQETVWHHYC